MRKNILHVFAGKSLKTQLIVLLFGMTALSILVIGSLGISGVLESGSQTERTTANSMQGRVQQLLVQTTAAAAEKNSLVFKNIQAESSNATAFTTNILDNPQLFPSPTWKYDQHVFVQSDGRAENSTTEPSSVYIPNSVNVTPLVKQQMQGTTYLDQLFPSILNNESNAVAIYYIGPQGETRYYPNIGLGDIVPPNYTPVTDVFFTPATPQNDPGKTVKWSVVYDDPAGNGLLVTASKPIYTAQNGFNGMVGIDVTLNKVAKNIESYSPIESSYAFLIDNAGRSIALPGQGYKDILGRSAKKNEFGASLQNVKGGFKPVLTSMRAGKSGFQTVNANHTDLYIAYAPLTGTNFSLGIVARKSVMLKVVGTLESQVWVVTRQVLFFEILPIALLILASVWFLGLIYIRFVTGPLIELTDKTHRVTQGDLKQRMDVTSSNEVGKLASAFNTMTEQLTESYAVLEQKVRSRTHDLNRKVIELGTAKTKDDAILNSIGDGMVVTSSDGTILLINMIAAQLLGSKTADVVGQNIADFTLYNESDKKLATADSPLQKALKATKRVNITAQSHGVDGAKIALSITATPVVENDKAIGSIQIMRDVTKEKEVDRMKTEFISLASHQLRTPLSAIKWFTEMLMDEDAGKLKPEQAEFALNIYQSAERMISLVNSLLNISRIESGRIIIDPHPTSLDELVAGIVNDLKAKTHERNQALTVEIEKGLPKINLDAHLIGQVYLNLLTNAIKYTPKGGKITVRVSRKGNEVVSEVSDNGYGIPVAEQGKLFQKFFRASNIVKVETDGTGLGMYLVKAIIESSGGKIWYKSTVNKGTTFWFSLSVNGMKAKEGEVTLGD